MTAKGKLVYSTHVSFRLRKVSEDINTLGLNAHRLSSMALLSLMPLLSCASSGRSKHFTWHFHMQCQAHLYVKPGDQKIDSSSQFLLLFPDFRNHGGFSP